MNKIQDPCYFFHQEISPIESLYKNNYPLSYNFKPNVFSYLGEVVGTEHEPSQTPSDCDHHNFYSEMLKFYLVIVQLFVFKMYSIHNLKKYVSVCAMYRYGATWSIIDE